MSFVIVVSILSAFFAKIWWMLALGAGLLWWTNIDEDETLRAREGRQLSFLPRSTCRASSGNPFARAARRNHGLPGSSHGNASAEAREA